MQFPDISTLDLLKNNKSSANSRFFNELLQSGTIDSYINLPERVVSDNIDIDAFRCPGDPHFCESGNQWISDILAHDISFD